MNTVTTLNALLCNALAAIEAEAQPPEEPTEAQIVAAGQAMLEAGWRPTDLAAAQALARYLAGPRRHGLMLHGSPGVGKTYFIEEVLLCRAVRARDIVTAYTESQGYTAAFWRRIFGRGWDCEQPDEVVIDDLGEEPECVLWGQREEVLSNVVCERYVAWKRSGVRTYVTTNMASADLDRRYGRRVLDRLMEMCVPVRIQGGSQRPRSWTVQAGPQAGASREVFR